MSLQHVIAFWQKVQSDEGLKTKVGQETNVGPLVEIACLAGFSCTAEELLGADNVIRFWSEVAKNETLREELKPAKEFGIAASNAIVRIASGHGFTFTEEQMNVVTPTLMAASGGGGDAHGEVDDKALANVVGGAKPDLPPNVGASLKAAMNGKLGPPVRSGPGLVPMRT